MQLSATIDDPAVIQRILAHLGLPGRAGGSPAPVAPDRGRSRAAGTSRRERLGGAGGPGPSRRSAVPVPDGPAEGSHPVIQEADWISDARSGRFGAKWEGAYPRCDKAGPEGGPSGEARPHQALGYRSPREHRAQQGQLLA
jgi:hypothetical protein